MITADKIRGERFDLSDGELDLEDLYNNMLVPMVNRLDPMNNVARADQSVINAEKQSQDIDVESSRSYQELQSPMTQAPSAPTSYRALGESMQSQKPRVSGLEAPAPASENTTLEGLNIKLSNYGYASDTTPDSYSARGIGHANNSLVSGRSVAITKRLADKMGIQRGAVLEIDTDKGKKLVTYDDTVPSYDKRTGALPDTIDIYRKNGSNSWGGKVQGVRIVRQGKKGLGGKKYDKFVEENYRKATQ